MIASGELPSRLAVGGAEGDEGSKRVDARGLIAAGDGGAEGAPRLRGLRRVEGGGGEDGLSAEYATPFAKALVARGALGEVDGIANARSPRVGGLARSAAAGRRRGHGELDGVGHGSVWVEEHFWPVVGGAAAVEVMDGGRARPIDEAVDEMIDDGVGENVVSVRPIAFLTRG